jgi:hypothetical protein
MITSESTTLCLLSGFHVFWQSIASNPSESSGGAGIIAGRDQFGVIEAAGRNVDLVREIGVLEYQLRSTPRAERAHTFFGRVESRRFSSGDSEIR